MQRLQRNFLIMQKFLYEAAKTNFCRIESLGYYFASYRGQMCIFFWMAVYPSANFNKWNRPSNKQKLFNANLILWKHFLKLLQINSNSENSGLLRKPAQTKYHSRLKYRGNGILMKPKLDERACNRGLKHVLHEMLDWQAAASS